MKIKQCHPGCSWHIFNSARSLFKAKPERAIAVFFSEGSFVFVSVFLLSESSDGILVATGCVAEMRCQSRAERSGLQAGSRAERTASRACRWALYTGYLVGAAGRAALRSRLPRHREQPAAAQTLTSTRLMRVPHAWPRLRLPDCTVWALLSESSVLFLRLLHNKHLIAANVLWWFFFVFFFPH